MEKLKCPNKSSLTKKEWNALSNIEQQKIIQYYETLETIAKKHEEGIELTLNELFIEACENYNNETYDSFDKAYFEGQKNAFQKALELLK